MRVTVELEKQEKGGITVKIIMFVKYSNMNVYCVIKHLVLIVMFFICFMEKSHLLYFVIF